MQGINSVAVTGVQNGQMNLSPVGDPVSRSLQSQIEELQKRILHISSDENMPMEEKQKKKQELENQIMELQSQLQQHLAEQRQEQQDSRKQAAEQKSYDQTGMQSVITADALMRNAKIQENTAARMDTRASVLRSEMELDAGREIAPVKSKENELAKAEQGAENARFSQMQILGKTHQALTNADKTEETARKEEEEQEAEELEKKKAPLMYTSEGRAVTEEKKSRIMVHA